MNSRFSKVSTPLGRTKSMSSLALAEIFPGADGSHDPNGDLTGRGVDRPQAQESTAPDPEQVVVDVRVVGLPGRIRAGRRHVFVYRSQETEIQDLVAEKDLQVGLWLRYLPVAEVTLCPGGEQESSAVSTSEMMGSRLILGTRHVEVDEVLLS